MLGTFYRAPKPGSAPFVEIGSVVDVDSVIAIIEVMKLMNTVRAGVRGVITEILPADEALVEFGDVLMRARVWTRTKPAGGPSFTSLASKASR